MMSTNENVLATICIRLITDHKDGALIGDQKFWWTTGVDVMQWCRYYHIAIRDTEKNGWWLNNQICSKYGLLIVVSSMNMLVVHYRRDTIGQI